MGNSDSITEIGPSDYSDIIIEIDPSDNLEDTKWQFGWHQVTILKTPSDNLDTELFYNFVKSIKECRIIINETSLHKRPLDTEIKKKTLAHHTAFNNERTLTT